LVLVNQVQEVNQTELKAAVEHMHGGKARLLQAVPVKETVEGATTWEAVVYTLDLSEKPEAARAYAWPSPIEGGTKRRFFAVLHMGAIMSPVEAVRAAIVAEYQAQR